MLPQVDLPDEPVISLEAVTFAYDGHENPVLRDVDLTIPFGSTVGIAGSTGSGKSTLLDLILGLLEPSDGMVRIGGQPLDRVRQSWWGRVGFVPQNVVLLDASLLANIALGPAEQKINGSTVEEALASASLAEFVSSLPEGLDTVIGERGVRLSGGQRQRVALARALYRRPDVLILDEGTSALDNVTERAVMAAVTSQSGRRTVITVAHRLTTIRHCDKIVVLLDGRIEATGTYDELLSRSPTFARLAADRDETHESV